MSEKSANTRQQLLTAAATVFSERGYAKATTREIAQTAGVAEGTIYRHFADKRELFSAVFAEQNAVSALESSNLVELAGTGTVRGNLERLIRLIEDVEEVIAPLQASLWADSELMKALAPGGGPGNDAGQPPSFLGPLAEYLAAEQKLGRINPDVDPQHAAFALFAIPFASVMTARMAGAAGGAERVDPMAVLDVVFAGLEPR